MINSLLKLALFFTPLYRRAGADTRQLKIILSTKLLVDDRSPVTFNSFGKSRSGGSSTLFVRGIILVTFGLMLALALFRFEELPLLGHTVYFTVFIVMLVSVLISDFTGMLIDVKDNYVILTRPVNDATVTISKLLHIGLHLTQLVIPLALPGWLTVFFLDGWLPALVFPVQTMLALFLSIFFVNALYLVMLKMMSPSRFRNIVTWFQVFLLMIVFTGYLFVPRLLEDPIMKDIRLLELPWSYFLPPVWISALHTISLEASGTILQTAGANPEAAAGVLIALSSAAILIPLACLFFVTKFLAPGFNRKLALIGTSGQGPARPSLQTGRKRLSARLAAILTRGPAENAGFRITWQLSSRLREFKINSYPAFAFIPGYFFYFIFKDSDATLTEKWQDLAGGESYLFILYLVSFLSVTFLQQVTKSDKYKAAWVYYLPAFRPGHVLSGMFAAIWVKLVLPAFAAVAAFILVIWGWSVTGDILLAVVNNLMISVLLARVTVRRFPFSEPNSVEKQFGKVFYYLQFMLLPVVLGFLHNYLNRWPAAVLVFTILSAGIFWWFFQRYRQLGWDRIQS